MKQIYFIFTSSVKKTQSYFIINSMPNIIFVGAMNFTGGIPEIGSP